MLATTLYIMLSGCRPLVLGIQPPSISCLLLIPFYACCCLANQQHEDEKQQKEMRLVEALKVSAGMQRLPSGVNWV